MANLQYKFSKIYGKASLSAYLAEKLDEVKFKGGFHVFNVDNCNVVDFVQGHEDDNTPIAMNTEVIPSKKSIEDAMVAYEKSAVAISNRQQEYPSIEDQLDDIYHNGIDGWKATIKVTKDKYPKG